MVCAWRHGRGQGQQEGKEDESNYAMQDSTLVAVLDFTQKNVRDL